MKKLCILLFALNSLAALAQTNVPLTPTAPLELFRAGEFDLDLYSTYTVAEPKGIAHVFDTDARHGTFGAGVGASWWMARNFGIGVDATIPAVDDLTGVLFDKVSLSLNGRLPFGPVAPYVSGGLGRNFESDGWYTQAGAGIEWRFNHKAGAFAEARYIFGSHEPDGLALRAGVRFAF
jgi:hypothetical protein